MACILRMQIKTNTPVLWCVLNTINSTEAAKEHFKGVCSIRRVDDLIVRQYCFFYAKRTNNAGCDKSDVCSAPKFKASKNTFLRFEPLLSIFLIIETTKLDPLKMMPSRQVQETYSKDIHHLATGRPQILHGMHCHPWQTIGNPYSTSNTEPERCVVKIE